MSVPTKFYLFKRANGFWYILGVTDHGKRWKSTGSKYKAEAVHFLRNFKETALKESRVPANIPLTIFVDHYLSFLLTTHMPKTLESARTSLRELLRVIGDLPLRRISIREIERFVSTKMIDVSPTTIRTYFVTLASAFETARRWKYIVNNPFREVPKPKLTELQPAYFTKTDFHTLLGIVADETERDLYITAVSTGLRLGELTALQWTDVDLIRRVVHVQNSDTFTTKSRRNRVVPMSEQLWRLLATRKEQASCELVFHKSGQRLTKDVVSKRFKQHVREVRLNDKLHFHSLRHTFASWLVQDGVSLYEVQKLLGHATVSMTEKYSHLQPEQLHSTVNRIHLSLN